MGLAKLASNPFLEESSDGVLVLQAVSGVPLVVPGNDWLLKADFAPQGADLLLTGPDGTKVLIRDYFDLDSPPDLLTGMNAMISAELAIKLAGPAAPGQFALIENGPFAELAQAAQSIGRVEATDGLVEAIRVDGTKVALSKGDDIFQGDTLVTAKGAAIGITFVDDTTFSLGEEGRMVLDELVYDPATQEGQFSANLVQGVFSFVSGHIAKTSPDGMTVTTPVATIGIRGTKVAGRAAQEGEQNTISLLPETDAQGNTFVGQLTVTNQAGTVTLNQVGATVQITSAFTPPPPPVVFSPQQIQQNFGAALTTLSTTVAAKAADRAAENAQQADQAEAEAEQAKADAEAAAAEAEAKAAEAEAAQAEAEASGDPEAIAAAEAAAAEAEAKIAEAEAKAAEAEAKAAEAEAKTAEAEAAQAEAEHAGFEMQTQVQAFATFAGLFGGGQAGGDAPLGEGELGVTGGPDGPDGPGGFADGGIFGESGIFGEGSALFDGGGGLFGEEGGLFGGGEGDFGPDLMDLFGGTTEGGAEIFDFNLFANLFGKEGDFGDHTDTTVADTPQERLVQTFTDLKIGTADDNALAGGNGNTNFYFAHNQGSGSAIGGTDVLTDSGGTNQLSFDGLHDIKLQFIMSGANPGDVSNSGDVNIWNGFNANPASGTLSTINFSNITQYLFSDTSVTTLQNGYSSQTGDDPTSSAVTVPDHDSGDIIVMPGMDSVGNYGYALVGTNSAETLTLNSTLTPGLDNAVVFGKDGIDTFDISSGGYRLLIGGINSADIFDYSSTNLDGNGASGLGFSAALIGGDGLVAELDQGYGARVRDMLWDVGTFIGTAGPDRIIITNGFYTSIEGAGGADSITAVELADTFINAVAGGGGGDTFNLDTTWGNRYTYNAITDSYYDTSDPGYDSDLNDADNTWTTSNGRDTINYFGDGDSIDISALMGGAIATYNTDAITDKETLTFGLETAEGFFHDGTANRTVAVAHGNGTTTARVYVDVNGNGDLDSATDMEISISGYGNTAGLTDMSKYIFSPLDAMASKYLNDTVKSTTLTLTDSALGDVTVDLTQASDVNVVKDGSLAVNIYAPVNQVTGFSEQGAYYQGFTVNLDASAISANTTVIGSSDANIITGGSGVDTITGGAGIDTLTGGSGNDVFRYTTVTDSTIGSLDTILDFVSGDEIDTNIIGTLAVIGDQSTGDTLANLTLTTLNALAQKTTGTLAVDLTGDGINTEVMQLTTTDTKTIWAIDVDGSGNFDASDTIIDVTGLTGTIDTTDFV